MPNRWLGQLIAFSQALLVTYASLAPNAVAAQSATHLRIVSQPVPRDTISSVATVIQRARDAAPAARVSAALARIADRTVGVSAIPLLPFVSLEGSATRQTLNVATFGFPGPNTATDPFNVYAVAVRAQQTLLDVAAWRRVAAQRDSARAAQGDNSSTRDGLSANAAARYFILLATKATLDSRVADSLLAASVLGEVRVRQRIGELTDIDVTRAELGVAGAAVRLNDARTAQQQARLDLALAMGLPPERLPNVQDSLRAPADEEQSMTTPDNAAIISSALERRPDLLASRARAKSATALVQSRRLQLVPRIAAFGEYAFIGTTADLPSVYRVGVSAQIPLIDGFARQRLLGIDRERQRLADAAVEQAELQAEREVNGARLAMQQAVAGLVVADAQLPLTLEELAQAKARVLAGVGGSLETTQAISAVAAARDQVIAGRLRYHLARVEWHRATATLDALH